MLRLFIAVILASSFSHEAFAGSHGNLNTNASSSIARNLAGNAPSGVVGEFPFINIFKTGDGWFTHTNADAETGEETYLYANCLDANGYALHLSTCPTGTFNATFNGTTTMVINSLTSGSTPWKGGTLNVTGSPTITACPGGVCGGTGNYTISATVSSGTSSVIESPTFQRLVTFVNILPSGGQTPYYPGGNGSWDLIYDGDDNGGSTNFVYGNDATFSSHSCAAGTCTDVLNVIPSQQFRISLTVTDPNSNGKYVKNIKLVRPSQLSLLNAGQIFNPDWLQYIKQFRAVRTMPPSEIIGNSGTTLPPYNWVFWQDTVLNAAGPLPIEVYVALANAEHFDLWINTPCLVGTSYITSEATYIIANLDPRLKIIHEACNETWNFGPGVPGGSAMRAVGQTLFPSCNTSACAFDYVIYLTTQAQQIYNSLGVSSPRFVNVMPGQYGNTNGIDVPFLAWLATFDGGSPSYWTGQAVNYVKALAIAPYYVCVFSGCTPPLAWTADPDGGIAKFTQQAISGNLLPPYPVFGATTGSTTTFALATTYTPTIPSVPPDNMCVVWTANHTSSSATNTLSVDSGTAHNLAQGASTTTTITTNYNYLTCYQAASATWQITFIQPQASCGNGAGKTCHSSSTAFTFTSGQSIPDPPANGQCTWLTADANGAGGNTLAVDGGTPYPLVGFDGIAVNFSSGQINTVCFLNKTSAGSVTASWQLAGNTGWCGSEIQCINTYLWQALQTANTNSIALYGYEGGLNLIDPCATNSLASYCGSVNTAIPLVDTLFQSFILSPQVEVVEEAALVAMRNQGLTYFSSFQDQGLGWGTLFFPDSPNTYAAVTPTHKQNAYYDYMHRNPCWWAGCQN